jgi:hypothetical protein
MHSWLRSLRCRLVRLPRSLGSVEALGIGWNLRVQVNFRASVLERAEGLVGSVLLEANGCTFLSHDDIQGFPLFWFLTCGWSLLDDVGSGRGSAVCLFLVLPLPSPLPAISPKSAFTGTKFLVRR